MRNTASQRLLFVLVLGLSGTALAQPAVQLNSFRAAQTADDGFATSRPNDRGHLRFGAQLVVDYDQGPLVPTVSDSITANLGLSLGFWHRVVLFAALPVNVSQTGSSPDGAGPSDVELGGRFRLFGEHDDSFALALQVTAFAPTADLWRASQRLSGEVGWSFQPELLAELRPASWMRFTANAGLKLRALDYARISPALPISHEFVWSAALTFPLCGGGGHCGGCSGCACGYDCLALYLEAFGRNTLNAFDMRGLMSVEGLAGIKWQPRRGLYLGLAGGTALLGMGGSSLDRGYGAADVRVIGTIGWAERAEDCDSCAMPAATNEPTSNDTDGDGVPNDVDQDPTHPEDRDGYMDDDGAPDLDNDGDGVADANDAAPNDAEDADGFQDEDGAPDLDNDSDGVADANDAAPNDAEDADGFADEDGAPEADNDSDGILDGQDHCPMDPGQPSSNPEENGCPRSVRVDRATGRIVILQKIEFANGRDTLLPSATPILEEVRAVLAANPQIRVLRVEGHTDSRGNAARNLDLSRRRGATVVTWLTAHGIDGARLAGMGCGVLHPAETNDTDAGRQANRRVEFHIVNPAPSETLDRTGCVQ